jgi:hypothetical protein
VMVVFVTSPFARGFRLWPALRRGGEGRRKVSNECGGVGVMWDVICYVCVWGKHVEEGQAWFDAP